MTATSTATSVPDSASWASQLRALQIASAGYLHVLLVGPSEPMATMLANRLPNILPALDDAGREAVRERYRRARIALPIQNRPLRTVRANMTAAELFSENGDVALAQDGILFLPSLRHLSPEPRARLHDTAREQGTILLAWSAACECGNLGSARERCTCSPAKREGFRRVLDEVSSGFDVITRVHDQKCEAPTFTDAIALQPTVHAVRLFRQARQMAGNQRGRAPLQAVQAMLDRYAPIQRKRIRTIARIVADLDFSLSVTSGHVNEAKLFSTLPYFDR